MPTPPTIVAHRGLHAHHPENSLPAFRDAWASGVAWCECDVHHSIDGLPFVIHDDALDRTTTSAGPVGAATAQQLEETVLKDAAGRPVFATVPHLWDVLKSIPPGGGLLVEIKSAHSPADLARTVDLARRYPTVIQSFDPAHLATARRVGPDVRTVLLVGDAPGIDAATDGPWDAVHLDHKLVDEPLLRRLRKNNKGVGLWTPTAPPDLRRAIDLGVDTIITDDPLLALRML